MVTAPQRQFAARLSDGFDAYEAQEELLPGLTPSRRAALIWQLVDSSRVNAYVEDRKSVV